VTTHLVKSWPEFYHAVEAGYKHFEVRRNDRDYNEGDLLLLQEYDPRENDYTGRSVSRRIGKVWPLDGVGVPGFVAFDLLPAD
jgi:hypothetical protein